MRKLGELREDLTKRLMELQSNKKVLSRLKRFYTHYLGDGSTSARCSWYGWRDRGCRVITDFLHHLDDLILELDSISERYRGLELMVQRRETTVSNLGIQLSTPFPHTLINGSRT